jgi:hypothetical protein
MDSRQFVSWYFPPNSRVCYDCLIPISTTSTFLAMQLVDLFPLWSTGDILIESIVVILDDFFREVASQLSSQAPSRDLYTITTAPLGSLNRQRAPEPPPLKEPELV